MTVGQRDLLLLIAVAYVVSRLVRGVVSVFPITDWESIPGPPGGSEDSRALCRQAPWQSYGARCKGYTWDVDANGQPFELRRRVGTTERSHVW